MADIKLQGELGNDLTSKDVKDAVKESKIEISTPGQLKTQDWKEWADNLLTFSTPALVIFLGLLSSGVPLKQAAYSLYGAIINALIDLLKKRQSTRVYAK